jgi:hypothetical protein
MGSHRCIEIAGQVFLDLACGGQLLGSHVRQQDPLSTRLTRCAKPS